VRPGVRFKTAWLHGSEGREREHAETTWVGGRSCGVEWRCQQGNRECADGSLPAGSWCDLFRTGGRRRLV